MVAHIKWPSIESFHNIRKTIHQYPELVNNKPVTYKSKIKEHGTNSAIQIVDGEVYAQSRTSILSETHDNYGFRTWVHSITPSLTSLPNNSIFYGEWIGKGINHGCAVHSIPNKVFAVFSAVLENQKFITEPNELENYFSNSEYLGKSIYILPWFNEGKQIDWRLNVETLQVDIDEINNWVYAVEACDPWVKDNFGIEGLGEGLVFYPTSEGHNSFQQFGSLAFKAKGEKHRTAGVKAPVQLNPEVVDSMTQFVDLVLTEARLEQGVVEACEGKYDRRFTSQLIAWANKDILKECTAELEVNKLEWKAVSKVISRKAAAWLLHKVATT